MIKQRQFIHAGIAAGLAEFFGDHMLANGVIWPKEDVEPRPYQLHLLSGTNSRFMRFELHEVGPSDTSIPLSSEPLYFDVIGIDHGPAGSPSTVCRLLSEPGSHYDIIVDFSNVTPGNRVIMKNVLGDVPYGGKNEPPA